MAKTAGKAMPLISATGSHEDSSHEPGPSNGRDARPARPKSGTTGPVVPTSNLFMVPVQAQKRVETSHEPCFETSVAESPTVHPPQYCYGGRAARNRGPSFSRPRNSNANRRFEGYPPGGTRRLYGRRDARRYKVNPAEAVEVDVFSGEDLEVVAVGLGLGTEPLPLAFEVEAIREPDPASASVVTAK